MGIKFNPLVLTGFDISGGSTGPTIGGPVTGSSGNSILTTDASANLSEKVLTDGQLLIGDTGGEPIAASLTGTADQVNIATGAGSITLSLPQSIATTSSPTFTSLNLTHNTAPLILNSDGGVDALTLNPGTGAAARTYSFPDVGASASFVMTEGSQTVNGSKSFSSSISVTSSSNQLSLHTGVNQLIINSGTSAAARTYLVPDVGATANFVLTEGAQTINGNKTFGNDVVVTGDLTVNGTTTTINTQNLLVEDKLVTVNYNGIASSGGGSGIEVEEGGVATGYEKVSADRNSWELKAPNTAGIVTITPGVAGFTIDQGSHDAVTLTTIGAVPNANGASLSGQQLQLQPANSSFGGVVTTTSQNFAGDKTFDNNVIVTGNLTVNGTLTSLSTTDLTVEDKLVTLNKGGAAASAGTAGIELEENSVITGFVETSADRNSWTLKAPNTAGIVTVTPGVSGFTINQGSHDPVTLTAVGAVPNANGASLSGQALTLQPANATNPGVVTTAAQTFAGAKTFSSAPLFSTMTSGSILFAGTSGVVSQDNTNFRYDDTNNILRLGNNTSGDTRLAIAQLVNNSASPSGSILVNGISTASVSGAYYFWNNYTSVDLRPAAGVTDSGEAIAYQADMIKGGVADQGRNDNVFGFSSTLIQASPSTGNTTNFSPFTVYGNYVDSGVVTNMYDFLVRPSILGVGTVTNRYGIYVDADSGFTKASWISGNTRLGGSTYSAPTAALSVTGAVTISTNLNVSGTTTLNTGLSGPLRASSGVVSTGNTNLASEVTGTLPIGNGGTGVTSTPSNGQLLIGNGTGYTVANLTAGTNISITNGAGSITINAGVSGDINETSATLLDNQAVAQNVTGLSFANASIRSFEAQLYIVRSSTYSVYKLYGIQKGASWEMSQNYTGDDTGITFSITTAGQVQYTSTSTGSNASTKFRASVLTV